MNQRLDAQGGGGAAFKEAYASLNAAQKQAVDTIEGPVMVIAGPGTGKTQILTLRIANILKQTDTDPSSILALTFTESGAQAMRKRLHVYIDSASYRVPIFTFHGFAQQLIHEYPDAFPHIIGGRPVGDVQKITIIEDILSSDNYQHIKPLGNPSYYVPHIIRIIGDLKQEYIKPDELVTIIQTQENALQQTEQFHTKGAHKGKPRNEYLKQEKKIARNRELLSVYRAYMAAMTEQRVYDFDDMLLQAVDALSSNEDLLRDVQEKYQYILADEHQDVNGAQNKILELITSFHDAPNLFVVGDEKQAIYRFQGASLENFLYFEDAFAGTQTISLTENYRSGQMILDAAHDLVEVEDGPLKDLRVPLHAAAVKEAQVAVRDFSHQAVEDQYVVQAVQEAIAAGTAPEEIAVIVRTNKDVETMADALRRAGVAVHASADGDILNHPITTTLETLMQAVVQTRYPSALATVLHGAYWGVPASDVTKVLAAVSYEQTLEALLADEDALAAAGVSDTAALQRVTAVLAEARTRSAYELPHRVLEYVVTESGLLDFVMTHDPTAGVRVLRRILDEIEAMVTQEGQHTLASVLTMLQTRRAYNLSLNVPYISTTDQAVQVMTAHKSKGLEFETVFIPHAIDSVWGGKKPRTYFDIPLTKHLDATPEDDTDDQRRLLYVAMTRAKKSLNISYARQTLEAKETIPSRFFDDIASEHMQEVETDALESEFDITADIRAPQKTSVLTPEFIQTALAQRGLSATSLNNYLRNPWNYIYRNVLRIPEVQPIHALFGTVMHAVLESMTRAHTKTGALPDVSTWKKTLEQNLRRLPLSETEYTTLHQKGMESLAVYTTHMQPELPLFTREEFSVRVVYETGVPELPQIPLTGNLDRLDFDDDGVVTRVVDYKTGKAKSRNDIEGKTKSSDGAYKRQLVFYALLLSLHDDEKYKTRTGTLSFVIPDARGAIREETFVITDEEIAELKEEIQAVVQAVVDGSILEATCDSEKSDYCHLVEMLQR